MDAYLEKQQERIDELERQVATLHSNLQRLALISVVDEKYPYWHALVQYQLSEEQRLDLEYVLFIMSDRLNGTKILIRSSNASNDDSSDSEVTLISKEKSLRYPVLLFKNTQPTLEELQQIYNHLGIADAYRTTVLLKALQDQGMFKSLIQHLLS